jgi:hypothetical protein
VRSRAAVLGFAVAILLVAAPISGRAQALAEGDGPPPRPNTLRLDLGVASAVGTIGITFTRTFGGLFQMEAGVGTGYSGTQLSLMPKLVLGSRGVYFVTGAGLSLAIPTNPLHSTGNPVWLNVDAVGLELVSPYGLTFLASAGITKGLGGGDICTNVFDGCEPGEKLSSAATVWTPQLRVGWGYSF